MTNEISNFINFLNEKFGEDKLSFTVDTGRRYHKVVDLRNGGRSVYAFIDKNTGAIYKPASWNAPAKHVRGNINGDTNCCGKWGIAYLR